MTGYPLFDFVIAMCSLVTALVGTAVAVSAQIRIGRHNHDDEEEA
jgi:hypothetical protein